MTSAEYRIESNQPLSGRLLPFAAGKHVLIGDRGLAISLAAKNFVAGAGNEVRVVHVPTGEIVFRKQEARAEAFSDEL
jgi:hypothetical protein